MNYTFGRWGGEEFIYLYPAESTEDLFGFAEKIRKTIDETCFITIKHITISIGAPWQEMKIVCCPLSKGLIPGSMKQKKQAGIRSY